MPDAPPTRTPDTRYVFGDEIARGGMGVIHRATDTVLDREVAVKVLQVKFAPTSSAARRFVDEAHITGQLQHPGIPAVHDLGTLPDGRPFLAMKLIEGHTLDALVTGQDLWRPDLIGVFERICQAVAFAHSRGIIHRDLKPANVMVGAFGEVQVMDWGLAKETRNAERRTQNEDPDSLAATRSLRSGACDVADPDATTDQSLPDASTDERTQSGHALGTPAYMPPEQARGDLARIDRRSDVFALGGVLCAILTGQPPYIGRGAEVMGKAERAELSEAFARLTSCGADAELVALAKRCLGAEPAARPADAREVAWLVAAYRAEVERRLRTAERERAAAEAKAAEQRKKRRVQVALMAAGLVIVAGGAVFGWWADRQAGEKRAADLRKQIDDEQRAVADRVRLATNTSALSVWVGQCEAALRNNDADRAAAALSEIDRRRPDGGGEEFAPRIGRCHDDLAVLVELDNADQFHWTPDESRLPEAKALTGRWRAALAVGGMDPAAVPAAEAARRVNDSHLRPRLVATLDVWLATDADPAVREVLRLADPDGYRNEVRDAVQAGDGERANGLAARPEALSQPPGMAAVLGSHGDVPADRRRAILTAALRSEPDNLTLLWALGESYPINQRVGADERVRWFQAAVTAHSRNLPARIGLAIALLDRGDSDAAIAEYVDAIRRGPPSALAYTNLGTALDRKGDSNGAVAAHRKAIDLDPKFAVAHNNLGAALAKTGDFKGALAAYREAVRLDPTFAIAHFNLGYALAREKIWAEAIASYKEATRLKPDFAEAHFRLGIALFQDDQLDAAISAIREVIRLQPTNAVAHYFLGGLLAQSGDLDSAIRHFDKAVQLDPTNPEYNRDLARARREKADRDAKLPVAPPPRETKR